MRPAFRFKNFTVHDDKSTMKVGTDAVLLGSWVSPENAGNILDIGTGCGLIAMMLAQRCNAMIDGIDIDEASIRQARENIEKAGWSHRIQVIPVSFQHYLRSCNKKYDLIVSNPPFFHNSLAPPSAKKKLAKHGQSLSFDELITGVIKLLNEEGTFNLILPEISSIHFRELAGNHGLYCHEEMKVYPKYKKEAFRRLQTFRKTKTDHVHSDTVTILDTNGQYTEEYKKLTGDFYIHF